MVNRGSNILFIILVLLLSCSTFFYGELVFKNSKMISRVTGKYLKEDSILSPNKTATDYNLGGTDLGVIWEMEKNDYGIFFGDSYGSEFEFDTITSAPNGVDWRCNTLGFSKREDLEKGLYITDMVVDSLGNAKEIIYGKKDISGFGEWTSIPTGAIRVDNTDYVHYMNVRKWLANANWDTNYSGLYKSIDNGQNWYKVEEGIFTEESNFAQVGYWKKGNYVYMIGTKSGRLSNPRLARFKCNDIENRELYEYWNSNKKKWVKGLEEQATDLFVDEVGELSFIFHNIYKRWILLYFSPKRYNITVRYAKELTGEWSLPQEVAKGSDYSQLYGSYIHPLSAESTSIYYLMSMWKPYNVFLMKTEIEIQ